MEKNKFNKIVSIEQGELDVKKHQEFVAELSKPVGQQDLELIALLEGDIEELREIENDLDQIILESFEKEDELREHWLRLVERIEK